MAEDKDRGSFHEGEHGSRESARSGESRERCYCCPALAFLGVGVGLRERLLDRLPADFVEHAAGARREMLLAIRSLVDEALKAQEAYLETYRERKHTSRQGPERVVVE